MSLISSSHGIRNRQVSKWVAGGACINRGGRDGRVARRPGGQAPACDPYRSQRGSICGPSQIELVIQRATQMQVCVE